MTHYAWMQPDEKEKLHAAVARVEAYLALSGRGSLICGDWRLTRNKHAHWHLAIRSDGAIGWVPVGYGQRDLFEQAVGRKLANIRFPWEIGALEGYSIADEWLREGLLESGKE